MDSRIYPDLFRKSTHIHSYRCQDFWRYLFILSSLIFRNILNFSPLLYANIGISCGICRIFRQPQDSFEQLWISTMNCRMVLVQRGGWSYWRRCRPWSTQRPANLKAPPNLSLTRNLRRSVFPAPCAVSLSESPSHPLQPTQAIPSLIMIIIMISGSANNAALYHLCSQSTEAAVYFRLAAHNDDSWCCSRVRISCSSAGSAYHSCHTVTHCLVICTSLLVITAFLAWTIHLNLVWCNGGKGENYTIESVFKFDFYLVNSNQDLPPN